MDPTDEKQLSEYILKLERIDNEQFGKLGMPVFQMQEAMTHTQILFYDPMLTKH